MILPNSAYDDGPGGDYNRSQGKDADDRNPSAEKIMHYQTLPNFRPNPSLTDYGLLTVIYSFMYTRIYVLSAI
jgi:hypothetical protein